MNSKSKTNRVEKMLMLFLLSITIVILSCNQKRSFKKEKLTGIGSFSNKLTGQDSILMYAIFQRVAKVDTSFSNMRCAEILKYYDEENNLVIKESEQICSSDLREACTYKTFFDSKKNIVLRFSIDGMGNIVDIFR